MKEAASILHAVPDPGRLARLGAELDALVDETVHGQAIVGASILVAVDGRLAYERFVGWADREARLPTGPQTIFRLASMTKPLVSASILALAEAGSLDIDGPVGSYLPWFRPKWRGEAPAITLRHLLTHTGGLACGFGEPADGHPYRAAGVSDGLDRSEGSLEDNLRRLAGVELYAPPGTEWRYSLATDVLGAVLEAAGAAPLGEVIEAVLTGPLGMTRTAFLPADPADLAAAYVDGGPDGVAERMPDPCRLGWGGGREILYSPGRAFDGTAYSSGGVGMTGTAADYLRFLEAVRLARFPSPSAALAMTSDQIPTLSTDKADTGFGFGFSVLRADAPDGRSRGTFGWGGLYGTTFWVDPARGATAIILTNTALEGMNGRFPARVAEIVCAGLGRSPGMDGPMKNTFRQEQRQ